MMPLFQVIMLFFLSLFGLAAFFLAKGIYIVFSRAVYRLLKRQPPAMVLRVASASCALCLLIFFPIKGCNYFQVEGYRDAVPLQFDLAEIVYHDEISGFMEGCGVAIFRLSDANLSRIQREGLVYFESARLGRDGNPYHQYQPWRATPAAMHENLFRGCGEIETEPTLLKQAKISIRQEGAFFTTGHEQDLVVIPSLGVLIFSFNG